MRNILEKELVTEDDARDYIKLVHDVVNGNVYLDEEGDYRPPNDLTEQLSILKSRFNNKPVMPEYNHDKYLEAMEMISIHGTDIPEPIKGAKIILKDIGNFIKSKFKG